MGLKTNDEIYHNEQFRLLPQCFKLYPNFNVHTFIYRDVFNFKVLISKSSAAELWYVRKDKTRPLFYSECHMFM